MVYGVSQLWFCGGLYCGRCGFACPPFEVPLPAPLELLLPLPVGLVLLAEVSTGFDVASAVVAVLGVPGSRMAVPVTAGCAAGGGGGGAGACVASGCGDASTRAL